MIYERRKTRLLMTLKGPRHSSCGNFAAFKLKLEKTIKKQTNKQNTHVSHVVVKLFCFFFFQDGHFVDRD